MKITQESRFLLNPITITLESYDELSVAVAAFGSKIDTGDKERDAIAMAIWKPLDLLSIEARRSAK